MAGQYPIPYHTFPTSIYLFTYFPIYLLTYLFIKIIIIINYRGDILFTYLFIYLYISLII